MTTGPEAKAAMLIVDHQIRDQHYSTETATEIIRKANAAHYLPLLRKAQRPLPYSSPKRGGDCMCIGCLIHKEIERLEKGTA